MTVLSVESFYRGSVRHRGRAALAWAFSLLKPEIGILRAEAEAWQRRPKTAETGELIDASASFRGAGQNEFAEYVQARLPDLLRFGHALTGNPHDANDLVQDVLEKVGVRWGTLMRQGANLDAYVRRSMVNARTSRWRRRRRETLVAMVPDSGIDERDRFEDEPLWRALNQLPAKQRAVLVLRYYEDLSEAEIASSLGISAGTVKSHTSRAMAALRRALAEPEGGES